MQTIIYDKTDKARDEIATRKYHLPSRMRSLLVLIDGKKDDAELVQKISGLGLNSQSLQELLDQGFIHRVSFQSIPSMESNDTVDGAALSQVEEQEQNEIEILQDSTLGLPQSFEEPQTIFEAADDDWHADLNTLLADEEENRESRVDMMKRFLTETIKESLGLKGFFLQRKVRKAENLQDIHEIRQLYVSAILHAKGKDLAISLRDQFDQRMYVKFSIDAPEFLEN